MARRSDPWTIARASLASRRDSRDFLKCRARVSESQAGQEVLSQMRTITFGFSGQVLEEDASGSTNRQVRFLVRQCADFDPAMGRDPLPQVRERLVHRPGHGLLVSSQFFGERKTYHLVESVLF